MRFLLLLLLPIGASAHTVNYSFANYDEAKKAPNYIKFMMASTKVGLFTTHFEGFAKKYSINYELDGNSVKTARITLPIDQFDTDIGGRNDKMWNECFNYKKFPEITILIADPIPIDGQEHAIPAIINLRGTDKPILVKIKATRQDRRILAEVSGQISLKELEIPDPSILVAKVRDQVDLKAHLEASE